MLRAVVLLVVLSGAALPHARHEAHARREVGEGHLHAAQRAVLALQPHRLAATKSPLAPPPPCGASWAAFVLRLSWPPQVAVATASPIPTSTRFFERDQRRVIRRARPIALDPPLAA